MNYVIDRENIEEMGIIPFPDGPDLVGAAIKYTVNCGCEVIFGVRYKGGALEKCMLVKQCDKHPKLGENILASGNPEHKMYQSETDEVIAWAIMYGGSDETN